MIIEQDLENVFNALAAGFPDEAISWRAGATNERFKKPDEPLKCRALAYIDARDVMERLDQVVGPANWQNRYTHTSNKTVCEIGLRIDGEWVWKADGAGDTDFEAEKGALSDAFKRAAVRWGIGQYLYTLPSPWVILKKNKQIDEKELPKLQAEHAKAAQKVEWGSRAEQNTYRVLTSAMFAFAKTPHEVNLWTEDNKGLLGQLPVRMKKALWAEIQRLNEQLEKREAA